MTAETKASKPRGTRTPLPSWWLAEARKRIGAGITGEQLANALSERNPEKRRWDRRTVERFLDGRWPTLELVRAFCDYLDLPSPIFVARSFEEAHHLESEQRKRDPLEDKGTPEKVRRLRALDEAIAMMEADIDGQTATVESSDGEGRKARRSGGSLARGRRPTT